MSGRGALRRRVAGLALAGLGAAALPAPAASLLTALAGEDVAGEAWPGDRLAGKVVLVDFWATWCPPCLAEVPRLRALRETYAPEGFEIVGVSMDTVSRRELRSWLARQRVTWPQLHDRRGFEGRVARSFGVASVPRWFLFDRRGRLVAADLPAAALEAAVAALLALSGEVAPTRSGL